MNFKQLFKNRILDLKKQFLLSEAWEGLKMKVFMGFRICSGNPENELSDAVMIVEASLYIA